MRGSRVLTVRLGRIYSLQCLAIEHPKQYHIPIMQLFCAFARRPPETGDGNAVETARPDAQLMAGAASKLKIREDVQAVMEAIGFRSETGIALEKKESFHLELSRASLEAVNLAGAFLIGAKLNRASLNEVDLTGAILQGAILTDAKIVKANLTKAVLVKVDLTGVALGFGILTGAAMQGANLHDSDLCSTSLNKGTGLFGKIPTNADLRGAALAGTILSGAPLTGVKLDNDAVSMCELDQNGCDWICGLTE